MAREGSDNAAEMDRAIGGGAREIRAEPRGSENDEAPIEVFTPESTRFTARISILLATRAPARPEMVERAGRVGICRRPEAFPRTGPHRTLTGEIERKASTPGIERSTRLRSAGYPLGRQFRAHRVRDRGRHGRSGHDQRDFEFARKYELPITVVIRPADGSVPSVDEMKESVSNDGRPCELRSFRRTGF